MYAHEHPGQQTGSPAGDPMGTHFAATPIPRGRCTTCRSLDIGTIIDLISTICFPGAYLYLIRRSFPQIPGQGSYFVVVFPSVFTVALLLAQCAMLSSNLYTLPCLRNFVPSLELHTATKYAPEKTPQDSTAIKVKDEYGQDGAGADGEEANSDGKPVRPAEPSSPQSVQSFDPEELDETNALDEFEGILPRENQAAGGGGAL
eukprot:COSAG04_NODE_2173_length_4627_cov_7.913082_5_plen_203_part_00